MILRGGICLLEEREGLMMIERIYDGNFMVCFWVWGLG